MRPIDGGPIVDLRFSGMAILTGRGLAGFPAVELIAALGILHPDGWHMILPIKAASGTHCSPRLCYRDHRGGLRLGGVPPDHGRHCEAAAGHRGELAPCVQVTAASGVHAQARPPEGVRCLLMCPPHSLSWLCTTASTAGACPAVRFASRRLLTVSLPCAAIRAVPSRGRRWSRS